MLYIYILYTMMLQKMKVPNVISLYNIIKYHCIYLLLIQQNIKYVQKRFMLTTYVLINLYLLKII